MRRKVKRAFSYLRFSDRKQARGDSKRRQREWGEELCKRKGWTLDDSLRLEDLGMSAFRGKNAAVGALSAFRDAIQMGKVLPGDVLLVENLDRLSRAKIRKAWAIFQEILEAGVEIVTRTPERHYTQDSLDDVFSILEAIFIMYRAYEESATKSMRGKSYWDGVRAGILKGARHAAGALPAWVRPTADKKGFELIPAAAEAVRTIYRWAGEGLGVRPITTRLNGEKIGEHRTKVPPIGRSGRWTHSYVTKIIHDRTVLGEHQPHVMQGGKRVPQGEPVPGYFPAVIGEQEWYRVRQAARGRGREGGPRGEGIANLFTGVIRDARDGCAMHLTKTHCSGNDRRVLVSYGTRHGAPGSVRMPFAYDAVEGAFLELVKELKASDVVGQPVDARAQEVAALSGKLEEIGHKIRRVQERVLEEKGVDVLLDMLAKLDAEKKRTADRLDKLKAEAAHARPTALGEAQTLIGLLAQADDDERTALRRKIKARVRQLVESVWLLVWDREGGVRQAAVQVHFDGGAVRLFDVVWVRRGKDRGKTWTAFGESLRWEAQEVKGMGGLVQDLRRYRTDAWCRDYWEKVAALPVPPPSV